MIRLTTVFWLLLVTASGFAVYGVKYRVQGLEDELAHIRRTTLAADRQIRVLTAEWAYLNRPATLAELNRRYLSLAPVATWQLRRSIADIPLRVPSAPAAVAVAAPPPSATKPIAVASAAPTSAPKSLDELIARVASRR